MNLILFFFFLFPFAGNICSFNTSASYWYYFCLKKASSNYISIWRFPTSAYNPRFASHNLPISLFLFLYAFVKRPLCMHEKVAVFSQKLARFFQKAASFPTKHNYAWVNLYNCVDHSLPGIFTSLSLRYTSAAFLSETIRLSICHNLLTSASDTTFLKKIYETKPQYERIIAVILPRFLATTSWNQSFK